ncbi:hypothetical protein [Pseudofrankia sp. DC12]|uniref:hypothetical protein n=1 Tax=Pseudofrankia sp. DC12 TaxID=683315 RepID=UPI000AD82C0C|nr:hypothetical protein [Pseudofrankia sp. DC12]
MRFVVEIRHTSNGVEGEITQADATEPQRFSGWLELLRLLEPAQTSDPVPGGTAD